jgi:hypothetical protein
MQGIDPVSFIFSLYGFFPQILPGGNTYLGQVSKDDALLSPRAPALLL